MVGYSGLLTWIFKKFEVRLQFPMSSNNKKKKKKKKKRIRKRMRRTGRMFPLPFIRRQKMVQRGNKRKFRDRGIGGSFE